MSSTFVAAAAEFGTVLLALALFTGLGWPATGLLPLRRRVDALGAAPVLGFGWFGIAATLLYRAGLPPWSALAVLLASPFGWASLVRALRREKTEAHQSLLLSAGLACVVLLLLLPAWLGGLQFALFQGNEWDERNYVGSSVAYKLHSYAELDPNASIDPADPPPALRTGFGDFGRLNLNWRPTVAITYAALDPLLPGLLTTGAYTYRALMLALWFGAAAFGLRALLRAGPALTMLLSAALTVGFFGQYVLDIDAWSELAGLPLALTAVTVLALLLFPAPASPAGPRAAAAAVMVVAVPPVFFYPEVLPAYGVAAALLLGLAWRWHPRSGLRPALLLGLLLGLAASLLWCALYWHGTLAFLYEQVTSADVARPNWYLHFQRYLWGPDEAEWRRAGAGSAWTPYGLLSAPVDLLSGAFGFYFAVPPPTLPLGVRVAVKILLAGFLVVLIVQATRALVAALREQHPARGAFLLGGLACCATPVALALLDRLWQAGKLLSMIAPLVFLWLVFPLVERRRLDARCAPALLLVLAHLGFGLYRPVAARDPDGIHYPPPYPSVGQPPERKKGVSWDLEALAGVALGLPPREPERAEPGRLRLRGDAPVRSPHPLVSFAPDPELRPQAHAGARGARALEHGRLPASRLPVDLGTTTRRVALPLRGTRRNEAGATLLVSVVLGRCAGRGIRVRSAVLLAPPSFCRQQQRDLDPGGVSVAARRGSSPWS